MKTKISIFFKTVSEILTSFIYGIGFVIWKLLLTVVRCPLFWVVIITLVCWYIGTHPGEPAQYCPTCGHVKSGTLGGGL